MYIYVNITDENGVLLDRIKVQCDSKDLVEYIERKFNVIEN